MKYRGRKSIVILILGMLQCFTLAPVLGATLGDLVFEREDQSEMDVFPPSVFPHWKHRINYRCDACHNDLFKMEKGSTPVTMDMINRGESCGICHNSAIAFGSNISNCHRCHKTPNE